MRIASGAASSGFACNGYLDVWGEKVKAESGGRIDYQLFCDGILGRMGDTISRVEQGVAEVGWDIPLAYGKRFEAFSVIGVPGLYDKPEDAAGAMWHMYERGELGDVTGVKLGWVQAFGNVGLWMTQAFDPSNLGGLKVGMGSKMRAILLAEKGAVPLSLRVPEYYQALAKGSADGLLSTTAGIFDFSIQEQVEEHVAGPFGGAIVFSVINQKWYDGLPDDLKAVIDNNTGYETSIWASRILHESEEVDMANAVQKYGYSSRSLTSEELASWQVAFAGATDTWLSQTDNGQILLDGFKEAIAAEAAK
jgi:TRAP-type C4-dicarboxylate transport system substrate-binding protein